MKKRVLHKREKNTVHLRLFWYYQGVEKLDRKRCRFIVEKQQYFRDGSLLDGAFLTYDNEDKRLVYEKKNTIITVAGKEWEWGGTSGALAAEKIKI